MRRVAILVSAVALTAAPASVHAAGGPGHGHGHGHGSEGEPAGETGTHAVAIANRAFSPARVIALEGDAVTWRNQELLVHNVSLSDGAIFSGNLGRGERFTHRFTDAGAYPFLCTIHPFMRGQVDVRAALLQAASSTVVAGQEVALHGRVAAGGAVVLEHQPAGASAFTPLTSLQADASGRFHGMVRPQATTTYRAVTTRGASDPATVTVASRLRVKLTVRRSGRSTRLNVTAAGAGGAKATLQLYSRERFTWLDRRRGRLDSAGRAAFSLRAGLRYHARVVISSAEGVELGTSRSVKLPR